MDQLFKEFISEIIIGEPICHRQMAVAPLFINNESELVYLTLGQALADGVITVTEVSEGGSVPDLKVTNKADQPVLLLDGEELAGAKQNRVINTTILLEPNSTTIIPVSCTEQGRWGYMTPAFFDSDVVMSPSLRHHKVLSVSRSLRAELGHRSDQQQVWHDVEAQSARADVDSPTGAMKDVHEKLAKNLDSFCEAFPLQDGQNGLLVIVGNRTIGFDLLSRHQPFGPLYPKLLRSYATDAILDKAAKDPERPMELAREFMKSTLNATESRHKAVGLGEDCRFTGDTLVGSALFVESKVVHMAFFRTETDDKLESMLSSRRRRGFRL